MPTELLQQLEAYEHLLFEPLEQTSLDALIVLQAQWERALGHSPDAFRVTEALQDFIECLIYLDDTQHHQVEQAYLDIVNSIHHLKTA